MQKNIFFTDEDIISGIKNNDDDALKILYKTHFPMISGLVMNNSGSYQEAKDIYQDTILVFFNNIRSDGFKLECKIKTYLYSVARRLWLNELKIKSTGNYDITDNEEYLNIKDDNIADSLETEIQIKKMNDSMDAIGEPCYSLLKMFYIEKLSMNEIAVSMGYTNAENAKNQKYKCLQRLKKLFFSIKESE